MVQEIVNSSWGGRIMGAFWGILFGILLIIGSFVLIFWNEGHSLHTAQSLNQAQQILITVPNSPIDPQNNMRVIYFTGLATTDDTLSDDTFNVSEKAIKLTRKVELYQWKENVESHTEKEMGGSEKTTKNYTYQQVWSENLIDSSKFKDQAGHQNPAHQLLESKTQYAKNVTVGDFQLPDELITSISGATSVSLTNADVDALQTKFDKPVKVEDSNLYIGKDSQFPAIGDMKVSITEVLPQKTSIIGQQSGSSVQPFLAPAGQPVLLLEMGEQSPQKMIMNALSENDLMMWILRVVSLAMMMIGIGLILRPLAVIADVLPFLGSIVGFGTGIIAFLLGLVLWAIATSLAWFTVRPLFAIGLLVVVFSICYLVYRSRKKIKAIS